MSWQIHPQSALLQIEYAVSIQYHHLDSRHNRIPIHVYIVKTYRTEVYLEDNKIEQNQDKYLHILSVVHTENRSHEMWQGVIAKVTTHIPAVQKFPM